MISFREVVSTDQEFLKELLVESFNSDSELALGKGIKLGPPGYDNGILAKKIVMDTLRVNLIILVENQKCGLLVYSEDEIKEIHYFCLLPKYINQSIGTKVWREFEKDKLGVWQLETPDYSLRNHAFYQKNGFKKIGEKCYGTNSKSFVFEKSIG